MIDEPIQIGTLHVKNRLVMPPMRTGKTDAGHVTDELTAYYRDRAIYSRPGLIITEHSFIDDSGQAAPDQLSIASDSMIAEHARLTEAIHQAGSVTFVQINHAGSNGICPPVSASEVNIPSRQDKAPPHPLSTAEIQEIEELFTRAALRALKAGYDGIEIHCAHSYLLDQFYSPMTNHRTDRYGGSLENRLRFLLETYHMVRDAVGTAVPIAVRLGGADYLPGGATEEDAVQASVLLEKAGVDLIDLSGGMCFYNRPGHMEAGYFSSMSEKVKAAVTVPVILTGGVHTMKDADRLLLEGKADLIGVGRDLLKDAHWREKN